jgi:hypothetical protein
MYVLYVTHINIINHCNTCLRILSHRQRWPKILLEAIVVLTLLCKIVTSNVQYSLPVSTHALLWLVQPSKQLPLANQHLKLSARHVPLVRISVIRFNLYMRYISNGELQKIAHNIYTVNIFIVKLNKWKMEIISIEGTCQNHRNNT